MDIILFPLSCKPFTVWHVKCPESFYNPIFPIATVTSSVCKDLSPFELRLSIVKVSFGHFAVRIHLFPGAVSQSVLVLSFVCELYSWFGRIRVACLHITIWSQHW